MDGVCPYTHAPDGSVYPVFPAPENTLPVGQTSSQSSTTLASDAYALPQRCQPLPYEDRMSSFQWEPYGDVQTGIVHGYTRSHHVNAEVYPSPPEDDHSSMRPPSARDTLATYPGNGSSHYENLPPDCPSDSLVETVFPWFINNSSAVAPVLHAPEMGPSHQHEPSVGHSSSFGSQSSGPDHFLPLPDAMPHCQAPPTHIDDPTPDPALNQPQIFSREQGTEASTPSRRPGDSESMSESSDGTCEAPRHQYTCPDCGKTYKQPQGLSRHRREAHERTSCIYCGDFKWGRRYILRRHIEMQHRYLDIEAALEEATRARRRHNRRKASYAKGKKSQEEGTVSRAKG